MARKFPCCPNRNHCDNNTHHDDVYECNSCGRKYCESCNTGGEYDYGCPRCGSDDGETIGFIVNENNIDESPSRHFHRCPNKHFCDNEEHHDDVYQCNKCGLHYCESCNLGGDWSYECPRCHSSDGQTIGFIFNP